MNLSTTTSWRRPRLAVKAGRAELVASLAAVSAGVHGALVVPHLEESVPLAVSFALATVALAAVAIAVAVRPGRGVLLAAAGALLTIATAYVLSRTTGIPGLTPHPEAVDALGVLVTSAEVAGAVLASSLSFRRSNP